MSTDKECEGCRTAFDQAAIPPSESLRRSKNDRYELLCLSKIAHIARRDGFGLPNSEFF